jgi:hypothetical protein
MVGKEKVFEIEGMNNTWIEENVTEEKLNEVSKENKDQRGVDLFWYRKMMFADMFLDRELTELNVYLFEIQKKVKEKIASKQAQKDRVREIIKQSIKLNPNIKPTSTGGKSVKVPDVGSISLSKKKPTITWIDEEKIMKKWKKCIRIIPEQKVLDKKKAKEHFESTGEIIKGGMSVDFKQSLTIRTS